MTNFSLQFLSFKPLWLLLILIPLLIAFNFSLVRRKKIYLLLSFLLRTAAIILLIIALCGPLMSIYKKSSHINFLIDISDSIDVRSISQKIAEIKTDINTLNSGDSYSIFYFAKDIKKTSVKELYGLTDKLKRQPPGDKFRRHTNISKALNLVRTAYPVGKNKVLCLYSDGIPTDDGLKEIIKLLNRDNINFQYIRMPSVKLPEVAVTKVTADRNVAFVGEKIKITANIFSNCNTDAIVKFANNGIVLKEYSIKLTKDKPFSISSDFTETFDASDRWDVEVVPVKDHFLMNNQASCYVTLTGKVRVLALDIRPPELKFFSRALKAQNIVVDVRDASGMPDTLRELLQYDVLCLTNLPATMLSQSQMSNIKRYVIEFGGGLIMTGSSNSFGLGGYYKTPVEDVLPLASRYEKEKEQPTVSIALIIDKSGSMNGPPIRLAREAAISTLELLGHNDRIAVIAFDTQPYVICNITPASNAVSIKRAIRQITAGGGTSMYPAMVAAKNILEREYSKIKHVIVLTDGRSTPGDFEDIASQMADMGITVSTVALGPSADRQLLSTIANIGKGRYYETMSADTIPKIFAKETIEASRSAIKEAPFVPVKIKEAEFLDNIDWEKTSFLLGYVMTKLKKECPVYLITPEGDPLLATGRFGLGKSVAFTSDITNKWASEWINKKYFGTLWAQIIRYIQKKNNASDISISLKKKKNDYTVDIRYRAGNNKTINNIHWEAYLAGEHGIKRNLQVRQTGIGKYQIRFKMPYIYNKEVVIFLRDRTNGAQKYVYIPPLRLKEYRLNAAVPEILNKYKTKRYIAENKKIRLNENIRNHFAAIAMFLLLAGLLLRRVP